jgi:hypothetical protein
MEIIRVHPRGFRFLFFLYHGSAAMGLILLTGLFLKIISYDISFIVGILMISIPFFLIPPELIILLKERKLIFRHGIKCSTISFSDISQIKTSASIIEIKNHEKSTLLTIQKEYFKNIDLQELSEYLRALIAGHQKVDPMRYTSVFFFR